MGYVYEQMTMDDVNKVIEDMPPDLRPHLTGARGTFRSLLEVEEKNRERLLTMYFWAIDREKDYYIYARPYVPECYCYLFYFRGITYFVNVNKLNVDGIVGRTGVRLNLPDHLKEEFQSEFIEACRVLLWGAGLNMHPVHFEIKTTTKEQ
jgi:hypothetical protein